MTALSPLLRCLALSCVCALAGCNSLDRFETKARGDLKHVSILAYRRRFTRAHDAYITFLETGRPPSFRERGPRTRAETATSSRTVAAKQTASAPTAFAPSAERMIEYPFPLRSGQVAMLRLPVRFDKADADRMAAFIRTLVFDPILELTAGDADDSRDLDED